MDFTVLQAITFVIASKTVATTTIVNTFVIVLKEPTNAIIVRIGAS